MKTTACIDGSAMTVAVCDAASWAAKRLSSPLRLLHVLEKQVSPAHEDLSGAIGLGSREHLLEELVALDQKRGKLAMEHGRHMLDDAKNRASDKGLEDITIEQRHGVFLEEIEDYQNDTRLFVIGRQGKEHESQSHAIGSQLENMVRGARRPVLVTTGSFKAPENYMIAYDGSETANETIHRFASSPLLKGLTGHIVMVGEASGQNRKRLESAAGLLRGNGLELESHLLQGSVIEQLEQFQQSHHIELKVMGAYGHSRIREFFVGSHTSKMIIQSPVPLLLLR